MTFDTFGLVEPLVRAVREKGYKIPTPIQSATIENVLKGRDLMASAQTGTGKTAAFTLPLLQRLAGSLNKNKHPKVLVLTPTRELAAQIQDSILTYGKHLDVSSTAVFGGVKIGPQMKKLRQGIDILVATPGRLLDLHGQNAVNFKHIEVLVLDEADRMLDMGFIPDIKRIQSRLPEEKQSLLFSATFSDPIRTLAKTMLQNPIEVDVAAKNSAAETVQHHLHPVDKKQKSRLLSHLIQEKGWTQVLVFTKTKHGANRLVKDLGKRKICAMPIHGNKSQAQRTKALADFKRGKVDILVATDIAARGLDIVQLPLVVNFDLPHVAEDYVHRIGRTGRAGNKGQAISLVSADEIKQLQGIERLINRHLHREEVEGFEPDHALPESNPIVKKEKSSKITKLPGKKKSNRRSRWSKRTNQRRNRTASGNK
jgi:ATP-dependent RNA helicase RhlE